MSYPRYTVPARWRDLSPGDTVLVPGSAPGIWRVAIVTVIDDGMIWQSGDVSGVCHDLAECRIPSQDRVTVC